MKSVNGYSPGSRAYGVKGNKFFSSIHISEISDWPFIYYFERNREMPHGEEAYTFNLSDILIISLAGDAHGLVGWLVSFTVCQYLLGYLMPKSVF